MYPRANQFPQSISLITKKLSAQDGAPPLGQERHQTSLVSSKQCSSKLWMRYSTFCFCFYVLPPHSSDSPPPPYFISTSVETCSWRQLRIADRACHLEKIRRQWICRHFWALVAWQSRHSPWRYIDQLLPYFKSSDSYGRQFNPDVHSAALRCYLRAPCPLCAWSSKYAALTYGSLRSFVQLSTIVYK